MSKVSSKENTTLSKKYVKETQHLREAMCNLNLKCCEKCSYAIHTDFKDEATRITENGDYFTCPFAKIIYNFISKE